MLVFVAAALAGPSQQQITYDLALDGEKVGTRDVTVRWIPRASGERRVVESYTTLSAAGAAFACRASGTTSSSGAQFTASVDANGNVSQVQGMELPGGAWRVIVVDGDGPEEKQLTAQMSTLDLFDPVRARALQAPGPFSLVLVETGEVLSGTLGEGQEGTIKVGGEKVPVTRYTLEGDAGKARFDVDGNGVLLRSELRWLGGTIVATAQSLPPARSFGEVETIDQMGTGVEEEAL
ncbi:MAG: hypothetical protein ACOZNI_21635 [Myxococcota bacterium]